MEKKKSWIRKYWLLLFLIFLTFFYLTGKSTLNDNSNQLPPLESEVAQIGNSLTMYEVINKNDYPWHNVEVIVNKDYSCWSRDILEPEDSILVNAVTCNQFAVNDQIIESIWIECDGGAERYSLK
jgi:hypothetical protein